MGGIRAHINRSVAICKCQKHTAISWSIGLCIWSRTSPMTVFQEVVQVHTVHTAHATETRTATCEHTEAHLKEKLTKWDYTFSNTFTLTHILVYGYCHTWTKAIFIHAC